MNVTLIFKSSFQESPSIVEGELRQKLRSCSFDFLLSVPYAISFRRGKTKRVRKVRAVSCSLYRETVAERARIEGWYFSLLVGDAALMPRQKRSRAYIAPRGVGLQVALLAFVERITWWCATRTGWLETPRKEAKKKERWDL